MGDRGQGNQSTLAEEAGPVRRWLTRYFRRRVPNDAEIEDMVQDVFTRMVARDSEEPVEHLGGYVLKTASSVLADRARRLSSHGAGLHVAFDSELHGEEAMFNTVLTNPGLGTAVAAAPYIAFSKIV